MNLEVAALHTPTASAVPSTPGQKGQDAGSARGSELLEGLRGLNLETADATEVIRKAYETFGKDLVLSSSFGADSALMIHLASQVVPGIRVIFIDTGYLFPETYRFAEELRRVYDFKLVVYSPKITAARQEALHGQLWEQGEEGVRRYLEINKVEPMRRALEELGVKAWLAGLRANQTEHRRSLTKVGLQDGRIKLHPILDWDRDRVEAYFAEHRLPRHPLVKEGYVSIGDVHSTIPIADGQDERAGRFLGVKRECGLHLSAEQNTSLSSSGL
jgi:phosphoadenosine phosphosulfate reductase